MLIVLAVALIAASDPDGVVNTAPRDEGSVMVGAVAPTSDAQPDAAAASRVTTQDLTTQEQIDRWLSARTPDVEPFADEGPVDDRQIHGFVSGSIGTDDFSAVSVGVSLPIGERGRVDLSYSQTRNGYGYGYPGYGYPGLGYDGYYSPLAWRGWAPTAYEPFFADPVVTSGGRMEGAPVRRSREVRLRYSSSED